MNEPKKGSPRKSEQGSALLVTLMVMVALSLLGLSFVTISETETAIAINSRNYTQVLAVAEAGAKTAVEWFQDPDQMNVIGLLPANTNAIKRVRTIAVPSAYSGRYKTDISDLLFSPPLKGNNDVRFFGNEENADVFITRANAAAFLDAFNAKLFGANQDSEITEILVYAPPMAGATLNGNGFFEGGTRYGVATIKATATKWRDKVNRTGVVAERTVKLVVSEWPFPGPQGPIQSNANLTTGGAYGVHWGKMTSQLDMEVKRPYKTLPWFNAFERIHFERGYDLAAWPLTGTPLVDEHNWLHEVMERDFQDPWFEARARGAIINTGGSTNPNPYVVSSAADDITASGTAGHSSFMQHQAYTDYPTHNEVIFPRIDYDFWKEIAIQGSASGQEGVYYLWPSCPTCTGNAGEMYTDGTTTQLFAKWVNTARSTNPARAGFYFFDSGNRLNPQGVGAPGVLAPPINVNSGDDGNDFRMEGFIYVNADFGTTGVNPPAMWLNFPGEPYRDIGFQQWVLGAPDTPIGAPNDGANNSQWDCQDLNGNGRCDIFVAPTGNVTRPSGGTVSYFKPVPWFADCVPPGGRDGTLAWNDYTGVTCSEPHEPFLNLVYPNNARVGGSFTPHDLTTRWHDNTAQVRHPKAKVGNTPVDCSNASMPANIKLCTSNSYDRDGRLVNDIEPMLNGVMYIEGFYDATGNAEYFGSLLVNGGVATTGTPEVWFDERLIKGDWPPADMNFPRVYISSHLTDQ